jgi:hypothetical protein
LFECLRNDREVAFAKTEIDDCLPFVGQGGKCREAIAAGILESEMHVLERERQGELG